MWLGRVSHRVSPLPGAVMLNTTTLMGFEINLLSGNDVKLQQAVIGLK